ncbi:unnamed protein product, partial [Aphanomyces euteiches]
TLGRASSRRRRGQNSGPGQGGPSQPTKAYVAPTPYETAVCFKHHGCGLESKRGERNHGISAGSAWETGPKDCSNCG